MPNLVLAGFVQIPSGSNLTLQLTVGNFAAGAAQGISPGVYVNAIDPTPPPGQNEIRIQKQLPVPQLASGATTNLSVTFPIATLNQKQVTRFDVILDPKNQIAETPEGNNTASFPRI